MFYVIYILEDESCAPNGNFYFHMFGWALHDAPVLIKIVILIFHGFVGIYK